MKRYPVNMHFVRTPAALAFLLAAGCATPPQITTCDPAGALVEPSYVTIGNGDLLNASLEYSGCEEFQFKLCGVGESWLDVDGATLGIWHDDSQSSCDSVILEDQTLNLGPLRSLYEDEFDVDAASLELDIGGVLVDYSFEPPEE